MKRTSVTPTFSISFETFRICRAPRDHHVFSQSVISMFSLTDTAVFDQKTEKNRKVVLERPLTLLALVLSLLSKDRYTNADIF